MKRFISLLLSVAILLTVSVPALAAEQSVNPDELYATMIPEVTNMTREEVDNLPEEQIDRYFEQAFDNKVSAEDYSYSEKLSAVEAVALVGKFEQATEQYGIATRATTSTKSNLSSYTGSKGVVWVRDTQKSPLSFGEALSGTFTLEVDYLTYYQAVSIYALSSDFNFFTSVKNAAGTAAASALICAKLKLPADATIPAAAISFAISLGWDILGALDRSNMNKALQEMKYTSLMKVYFMTANNFLTRVYECYNLPSGNVSWVASVEAFKYKNIPIPYDLYGTWYPGVVGKLYKLG